MGEVPTSLVGAGGGLVVKEQIDHLGTPSFNIFGVISWATWWAIDISDQGAFVTVMNKNVA